MYFAFVDWIERLVAYCKKSGGVVYWAWVTSLGIASSITGVALGQYGFNFEVRKLLAITLIIYIVPIPLVYYFEKRRVK